MLQLALKVEHDPIDPMTSSANLSKRGFSVLVVSVVVAVVSLILVA